ncbi:MAG TPA: tetratricopeptide repeat protein [Candidatus Omnitrophica bacterium]|nr:tetratricopeptide repeat protein [Candidatus Omnitrophota bacterium]
MDAEELLDIGLTYQLRGKLEKAEEYFKKALLRNPRLMRAYVGLGDIYLKTNRFDMAEQMYKKGVEIHPEYEKACLNLARLYILKGEEDKAFSSYERALSLGPNDWRASKGIGYLYLTKDELDKAIGWLKMALEGNEEDLAIHFWLVLAYHQKELKDEMDEEIEKVRGICNNIKKFLPRPAPILSYILGKVSALEGKYKEAIEHLEEVRKKVKVKNRRKLELGVFYNEIDILKTLAEVYEKNEQRALSHLIQKEIAAALAGS